VKEYNVKLDYNK